MDGIRSTRVEHGAAVQFLLGLKTEYCACVEPDSANWTAMLLRKSEVVVEEAAAAVPGGGEIVKIGKGRGDAGNGGGIGIGKIDLEAFQIVAATPPTVSVPLGWSH